MPASLPKIDLVAASIAPEISSELINETNADGDEGVASFEYAGEIADDDSDTIGASLISSSHGNSVRNYEVYNRMEGCSSDEETQTDNDDNNNDSEVEGLPDHHYAVLNDDMFEFGEFTAAVSCSAEDIQDNTDENEWQESVTGLSLNFVAPAVQGDGGMGPPLFSSNFDEITVRDGEEPAGMSTVLPPVAVDERELSTGESRCSPAIAYVSIPPLSAASLHLFVCVADNNIFVAPYFEKDMEGRIRARLLYNLIWRWADVMFFDCVVCSLHKKYNPVIRAILSISWTEDSRSATQVIADIRI